MTLRRALPITIVLVLLLLGISGGLIVRPYITLTDRWNKPTDFGVQFTNLTRQHLGINDHGNALSIALMDTYVQELYETAAGPENVTYTDYDPDRVRLDRDIFSDAATPQQRELAATIIQGLSTGKIAELLDEIRADPRVVVEPAPGSVIFACNLPDAAIRFVVSGLEQSAIQAEERGDVASAILSLQRIAGLVRAEYSVPAYLSNLVGCANEQRLHTRIAALVESKQLLPDHLEALMETCDSIDGPDLLYALEGDRLTMLDLTRASFKDSLRIRWDARSQMQRLDEVCTARIAQARRQLADWKNEPDRTPADRWTQHERAIYAPALAMAVSDRPAVRAVLDVMTVRDGSRAILAIEQYRREHGRLPESLDSLTPYGVSMPTDAFVSQPLRYRVVSDSQYILYSVGADGDDNSGTPAEVPIDAILGKAPGTDFILYPRSK